MLANSFKSAEDPTQGAKNMNARPSQKFQCFFIQIFLFHFLFHFIIVFSEVIIIIIITYVDWLVIPRM